MAYEPTWYVLYGRRVLSDIRLPLPEEPPPDTDVPHWRFRRMPEGTVTPEPDAPIVAATFCEHGRIIATLREDMSGAWMWYLAIATFRIPPGARTVEIYAEPDAAEGDIGLVLMGQVAALLLQQQGRPALHASAVASGGGATAFIGPKGRGKSTMAAFLAREAGALLTDDLLPLETGTDGVIRGLPGLPLMKAWDTTVEHVFGADTCFPCVTAGLDKKLIELQGRLPFHDSPAPIRTIFVLERDLSPSPDGACSVVPLGGRDAVAALLEHTAYQNYLTPARAAALLPLYARLAQQARILSLHYPSGFAELSIVRERILREALSA